MTQIVRRACPGMIDDLDSPWSLSGCMADDSESPWGLSGCLADDPDRIVRGACQDA